MSRITWAVAVGAVAVAVALMLTGCSTGALTSAPTTPGATPTASTASAAHAATACDLITEQDATAALGADPGVSTAVVNGPDSSCKFGSYPTLLTINLVSATGKADFDHLKGQDTGGSLTAVTGVGDDAFSDTEGPAASVWFVHGTAMVTIVVVLGSGSNPNDAALSIAHEADARL